jgi:hypothetical protein
MSTSNLVPKSSTSDLKLLNSPSETKSNKRSLGEKVLSAMFDGPSGTRSSKNDRELREKWEEDKLDIPRTDKEEKERQGGERTTRRRKNDKEEKERQGGERTTRRRKNDKEEKERQARIQKRNEMVVGGDGARTNDMQKEGWSGAMLAQSHA